jgi:hypothetical protein
MWLVIMEGSQSQQHILGFVIGCCDYILIKKDICN